jgi:outer membrane immunogenic protein
LSPPDINPFVAFYGLFAPTVFRPVCLPRNSILSGSVYSGGTWGLGIDALHLYHAVGFERLNTGEFNMKKLVLALCALAAVSGSAIAADLPVKAPPPPPPAPVYNWTGFYIFGGGGFGMFDSYNFTDAFPGGAPLTIGHKDGGDGFFGTVGVGYDWQFSGMWGGTWVAGVFADGQFGSIKGSLTDPLLGPFGTSGQLKNRTNAAAGVRVGYLVAPQVLSYVNGGYSYGEFSGSTLLDNVSGLAIATTPSFHRNGWFVGGGVENTLDIFGISAPGLFMKTEYRFAEYERVSLPETFIGGGLTGLAVSARPIVQTVSTSLVYRFNWSGPLTAPRY